MKRIARQAEKKLEEYKQTMPEQLRLFQLATQEDGRFSNTVELYDGIPKYFWGKAERIEGRFLEPLERDFSYRGKDYSVRITPAVVKDSDGVNRYYYPSAREELVEDALRKLACEGNGIFLDDEAGVLFSLYELQCSLSEAGHTLSIQQIKEALLVCKLSNIEIRNADGSEVIISSLFETVGLKTMEDWKGTGQKTKAFVRFNQLVTRCIKAGTFRQLNYSKSMEFSSMIARQLYKRMSHHFTQASLTTKYEILLTTVIRDFGITRCAQLRDNLRQVEKALTEMVEKDVILNYKIDQLYNAKRKNKLEDAKISIQTSIKFASEMKLANKRYNDVRGSITESQNIALYIKESLGAPQNGGSHAARARSLAQKVLQDAAGKT